MKGMVGLEAHPSCHHYHGDVIAPDLAGPTQQPYRLHSALTRQLAVKGILCDKSHISITNRHRVAGHEPINTPRGDLSRADLQGKSRTKSVAELHCCSNPDHPELP